MATQATAAAISESTTAATGAASVTRMEAKPARSLSLDQRIADIKRAIQGQRATIRFYENHPRLRRSAKRGQASRAAVLRAQQGFARETRALAVLQRAAARRNARRLARRLASAPPKSAICHVFGRYCREALAVSWCESRHSTTAQNGQYLGLFQMGSHERDMYGHGPTALTQALAAHKYFVLTDRDWSPWSCKPAYGL
jgi:hypothetical protein